MLQCAAPDRSGLVKEAIVRRKVSMHAYFRGIADARTDLMATELPVSRYAGKAGFVLNTGDMHLYQPTTIQHGKHGVMMGVGDSDRLGFGPYEWDVRSLATSVELEGRVQGLPKKVRETAVRSAVEAYADVMHDVAKAKDPGKEVKHLRVTKGHGPDVLDDVVDRAADARRKPWLEERVDFGANPPQLKREAGVMEDVPDRPAGAAARLHQAVADALPAFVHSLDRSEQDRFEGLKVADVAIPIKGNGSMGYGRYRVLLEPKGGARHATDLVIVEFKEQLPSALGRHVDARATQGAFGKDQAERSVNLYRLGMGKNVGEGWGHVTLPTGCGVESNAFTVKEVRHDEKGVEMAGLSEKDFVAMAKAQGRLLATFQATAGVAGRKDGVGGANDVVKDMDARPAFVKENVDGAQSLADRYQQEYESFCKAF